MTASGEILQIDDLRVAVEGFEATVAGLVLARHDAPAPVVEARDTRADRCQDLIADRPCQVGQLVGPDLLLRLVAGDEDVGLAAVAAVVDQAAVLRRERLRKASAHRSRARRVERTRKAGKLRFTLLALTLVATAVIVTIVMFETLAMIAG